MQIQLCAMLALQDKMNSKVHPQWRDQCFPWYRAIWTESAELLDHYGWKWWKKQNPDVPQIQLELVDIWHFGMSIYLQKGGDYDTIASAIEAEWNAPAPVTGFREVIEAQVAYVLSTHSLSIPLFCEAMKQVDLSFDDLYRQYIGKNVLNFFRQDFGYQQGTYQKIWHGKEDNIHLAEILATEDPQAADFQTRVYAALEARYPR
jgi:dimeric dUTPase (all-alpha-NTP-PPase superfamily)